MTMKKGSPSSNLYSSKTPSRQGNIDSIASNTGKKISLTILLNNFDSTLQHV